GSPATQHTARTTHTRAARGGSQHGYLPNRHRKMVANQTTSNQTSNQQQHLQLPNMRRRARLRALTPTQQRRGRPHPAAQSRRRRLARRHANHLSLEQPTQGQRGPTPQTDGAATARTTHYESMVESWSRSENPVPLPRSSGRTASSNRPARQAAPTPRGATRRPRLDVAPAT